MQLLGVRVVRVTARDDAGATGAAGTDGQERPVKSHARFGHARQVGGAYAWVTIGLAVIPGQVIRDHENDIRWLFCRVSGLKRQECVCRYNEHGPFVHEGDFNGRARQKSRIDLQVNRTSLSRDCLDPGPHV